MSKVKINTEQEGSLKPQKQTGQLSVDIFETLKEIIILAPVAGCKKKDLSLSITQDVLAIKGKRDPSHRVSPENYYTKECFWGKFSRSIVLPLEADSRKISANFEDCILEIRIPKTPNSKETKIIKIKNPTL